MQNSNSKFKIILILIIFFSFFGVVESSEAADIYVDQTLSANCTNGDYSTTIRDCSGSDGDAYITIQNGIAIMNGGDTLIIRGGTYNEYNLRPKTNTTIKGYESDEVPIIDGGQVAFSYGNNSDVFRMYDADNIIFDSLDIRNGGRACISLGDAGVDSITIQNCRLSILDWTAIYADDNSGCIYISPSCSNVLIKNNVMQSDVSGVMGVIGFNGDGSVIIENNNIDLYGDGSGTKSSCGIFWKHAGTATTQMVIQNNNIYTHGPGLRNGGIWMVNDNTLVHNNLVYGTMRDGIDFFITSLMGDVGGDNCVATHNTVYGAERTGSLYDAGDGGFNDGGTHNTFQNNIFYGIYSEYQAFSMWHWAESGNHETISDYNCYYSSINSTPIQEFSNAYSLSAWQAHSNQDDHSIQEEPQFANVSGNLNATADFEIIGGVANNGASNGEDMGADVSLVGVDAGAEPDTTPPSAPSGLGVN